ncbi:MAG: hypothetical protein J4478_04010 [Candidatus Diapherotrites archaeon]|uniref:DUF2269 family protein n=1 Tax=Candidatus Iainarchaeum sp. TaxID=3101447 RepID=A0A8T4KTW9_9ARCH|nr:MAG: hypothetical protein QT12_C0027G0011 [archaeon GW2011_AR21]MBS3058538.1 hypothetical protein [Candidatus Diapherotrites archaeon]
MTAAIGIVTFLHIISAIFMAWPLYALITVNERPKVGAILGDKVDDFMEGIIKKQAGRCYIFQITALITGLYLWSYGNYGLTLSVPNLLMLGKLLGLFILMGLLSYVVFFVQPKIDNLFVELKKGSDVGSKINALRLKRKKFAATCLFVLLAIIIFAVQIREPLSLIMNAILIVLVALFSYRVYKTNIQYGWV